jgi:vitamin K-dependent gamma-carboxylase
LAGRRRAAVWRAGARAARRLLEPVDGASVAVVRITVGLLVAIEAIGYLTAGWLRTGILDPEVLFTYRFFEWVQPWPEPWIQLHFVALAAVAALVAAGALYRPAAVLMCAGFAYVFLLDKSEYLNHFYAVVLIALLLVAIPADRTLSVRSWRRGGGETIGRWAVWALRFQIGVIYLYGGIAKLGSDWLAREPMGIWLAAREDLAVIGPLLADPTTAYAFAWGGLAFDLLIFPALLWRRTRMIAFGVAVCFHLGNAIVWDIGIFPWLMIGATTVFFEPDWPRRLGARLSARGRRWATGARAATAGSTAGRPARLQLAGLAALAAFAAIQLTVPLRHHLYPGDVNWTEEGHRFSWHMKLRNKTGKVSFFAVDRRSGARRPLEIHSLTTPLQRRRIAGHPDMIHQLARHLAERERARGRDVAVHAETMVSLNGRPRQPLVDPGRDLGSEPVRLGPRDWILPQRLPLR